MVSLKKQLRIIAFMITLSLLFGCLLFDDSNHMKKDNNNGKSTSGGYIIRKGDYYYFANPKDNNRLSRMNNDLNNVIRLSNHANAIPFIQITERDNHLYYLQIDSFDNDETIYKGQLCSFDLSTGKENTVFEKNVISYTIIDEWIYCSTINPAQMYRINTCNSTIEKVGDEHTDAFIAHDLNSYSSFLIYACDEAIIKMDTTSGELDSIPGYSTGMVLYNNMLYSINSNQGNILEQYNVATMASDRILVNDYVVAFAVFGEDLVFSTYNDEIYLFQKNKKRFLTSGSNPCLLQGILFYFDLNGNLCSITMLPKDKDVFLSSDRGTVRDH